LLLIIIPVRVTQVKEIVVRLRQSMYNLPVKVSQLGELGLIQLITEALNSSGIGVALRREIRVGLGDDAAAWDSCGLFQLGTTDILIQDVHFTLDTITWEELGWKALAVNISDIAAMGGTPQYALLSIGLPPDTEVDYVMELYRGMSSIAREFDLAIAGGDVVKAPLVIISPSILGTARGGILTRSTALPGDLIAVTGFLGSSAAGLRMLKAGLEFDKKTTSYLREAHLRPYPRVSEGQFLAQNGVQAAIDVSDGLIADLGKMCQASKVGAKIWLNRVPIHPLVKSAFHEESLRLALSGGEDYELLFAAKRSIMEHLSFMSSPMTIIGEVVADKTGEVMLLDEEGRVVEWERGGWEHFNEP
jgi:thiamine-monophosphate kinase